MSKRDAKGQQIKTFQYSLPMPDASTKRDVAKVFFKADNGLFRIFLPEHIVAIGEALHDDEPRRRDRAEGYVNDGAVCATTLQKVVDYHSTILTRYTKFVQTQLKEKVISLTYQSNLSWNERTKDHTSEYRERDRLRRHGGDISFCGAPALHVSYEILWKIGDKHFGEKDAGHLQYVGGVGQTIPWTAEREAFFAAMTSRLEELIMKMDVFTAALNENVDLAIAQARSTLVLEDKRD